ncbi:unnamed protein product [Allacma fusca]|uniref:Uncharacterized protein n=1 Tax=Allacma fusca TaxID=39272 RepID=A0A8J2KK00_9HEXA|nr:unnamed protein product [Allacma fusca]
MDTPSEQNMVFGQMTNWLRSLKATALIWWKGSPQQPLPFPVNNLPFVSLQEGTFKFEVFLDVEAILRKNALTEVITTDAEDDEFFDPIGNFEDWV